MKRTLALLAGCLLSACAALVPKLEPPQLTVTRVELVGGNLQLSGEAFAAGSTEAAFTLPASGETDFGLNVTANLDAALTALLSGLGHRTVDYRMYGQVHLRSGLMRNFPFEQKGRVKL